MIHKLESAGLGYHVTTLETHDRLGTSCMSLISAFLLNTISRFWLVNDECIVVTIHLGFFGPTLSRDSASPRMNIIT